MRTACRAEQLLPSAAMMHAAIAVLACLLAAAGWAQPNTGTSQPGGRVEILNADEWLFDRTANGAQRLRGNVRFKHADALMRCDSAHLFEDQRVDAFGRVSIQQADTLTAEADRLRYSGRDRVAQLEGNVRLRDRTMELTTPSLAYDMKGKRATYSSGGRITSMADGNVLTSGTGTYLADQRRFIFGRKVLLEHPDRRVVTDTMHYDLATAVCAFHGPTTITQFSSARPEGSATVITTRGGSYDTRAERARFNRRTRVVSKGRALEGDSLFFDKRTGVGLSWGNVSIADSSGDMRVLGAFGRYNEIDERSMVTGRAELQLRMGADTLFLHGDTLFAEPHGGARRITARRSVRFFKSDIQGACDTLVYSEGDSLITLRHEPVLWSNADQITGDTIRIRMRDGQAHRLHVARNAFLLSQADSLRRDQVAGITMTGYFAQGELNRLEVEGNARTVYHAKEQRDGGEEVFGVNRADCSRIRVRMKEGRIDAVVFLERPEAVLYPLENAPTDELVLPGMLDRAAERPLDRSGIFLSPR